MRNKFLFCAMILVLMSFFILAPSMTHAAPQSICISGGDGDWAVISWSCFGAGAPGAGVDVYIENNVSLSGAQSAGNVTVDTGKSLNTGANSFTVSNLMINSTGWFTGTATVSGNLTDNGSFNGSGQTVSVSGTSFVGSGATFTAGSGSVALNGATTNSGTMTAGASTTFGNDLTNNAGATFNCGSNTVTFKGNLTANGTFNCSSGTANFQGSALQNVGGSGALSFSGLTVNNAAGVTLNQNASVSGALTFTSGDLNTGLYTLTLTGATVTGAGGGDVVGNAKRADAFSTGTPYVFNSPNTLINFSALSVAPTDITINLIKSIPTGFTRAMSRQYTILASGSPVFTATMQLHYKSSEVTGSIVEANLMPWRYNTVSGRWELQPGSDVSSGDNSYVQATGVTGFSLWTLSDNGAPTAVTLSTFTASGNSTQNNLMIFGMFGVLILAVGGGGWMFKHR